MKIVSAEFLTSAPASRLGIPDDGLPQVALVGRSNVGKSSLINALARRKIARTSAAPGKTRLANIYRVALVDVGRITLYFVDLPGYGYARGGADARGGLQAVAEAYLSPSKRPRPERGAKSPSESERGWGPASADKSRREVQSGKQRVSALLLVDARHPDLESDRQAARWLASLGIDSHIVATKIDKLTRAERARNLNTLGETFGKAVLPVSAASGEGLDELWRMIVRIVKGEDKAG